MRTLSIVMLALCVHASVSCHQDDDTMTRMTEIPTYSFFGSTLRHAREHVWCMAALTAALGYIYAKSVLDAIKPDPYEGPLREAHAKIAELEKALLQYQQIYRFLEPVLRKN